jgi:hypothetical protein
VDLGHAAEDGGSLRPSVGAAEVVSDEEIGRTRFLHEVEEEVALPSDEDDVAGDDLAIEWCDRHELIVFDQAAHRTASRTDADFTTSIQRGDGVGYPTHTNADAGRSRS